MKPYATPEGTHTYAQRFAGQTAAGHFRAVAGVGQQNAEFSTMLSTLGIGTYLGEPDTETDRAYTDAVIAAVESGFNVVDTAINYRLQRSERSVGAALAELARRGYVREEIVLCTKAGYLTPDGSMPPNPGEYFRTEFIDRGILKPNEIAAGCHSMAPRYLADQLERSLRNLGVSCVDIFYLHNPETQLAEVSREEFLGRLGAAFVWLESAVASGKIRAYGLATWNGFRVGLDSHEHLSLAAVEAVAREVAGDAHHFRFVQLPVNLAMTDALTRRNQAVGNGSGEPLTMIEAADKLGIHLIASASLLQGRAARKLPPFIMDAIGLNDDVERALQFVRSLPGITMALVGMSRTEHVRANARLFREALLGEENFSKLFARGNTA
jgi:aryl-alcohol dehydrogenase-like predicted oxidoreductase